MIFIYGEQETARCVGLSRKQLYDFRCTRMTQGVHWDSVQYRSRKKTALSEDGLCLLLDSIKNGALTGGEPLTADGAEIRRNALLSEMPTGNEQGQRDREKDGQSSEENYEKKPSRIAGLLPAPPGCEGFPIEAVLVVFKSPSTISNRKILVCRVKPGQMPEHHLKAVTNDAGLAHVRVQKSDHFITGMELPARHASGNVWDIARPCPRRKGRW